MMASEARFELACIAALASESIYSAKVCKWLWIAPDFQFAEHPGYNRDRGAIPIYAVRAHVEF
jgi:hypothetical protein